MNNNRQRLLGVALTTIGFVLAALAGLALASQVNTLGTTGLFVGAGLTFVLVIPLLIAGVYFYARGSRETIEPESTLPKQVQLTDIMKMRQKATLDTLARELAVTPDEVVEMIHQLAQLELFSGYLTPEGELAAIEPIVIQHLSQCQRCGKALKVLHRVEICPSCGTEYYAGRVNP